MYIFGEPSAAFFGFRFGSLGCISFQGFDCSCCEVASHNDVRVCYPTNRTLDLEDVHLNSFFGCLWYDFSQNTQNDVCFRTFHENG